MKHILNNLTEEEKNSIREQHTGGMKVMNENFYKLLSSKLGDVRPLSEQKTDQIFTSGQTLKAKRSTDGQVYTLTIVQVTPNYLTAKIKGPGKYQGKILDGTYPLELTLQPNGNLVGNMEMGEFTIIK